MRKKIYILGIFVLIFLRSIQAQTAVQPDGEGTIENPFEIENLENLCWLSKNSTVYQGGYNFIQTADINASATRYWNDGKGFSPIGVSWNSCFNGVYDGGGFTIDSLYINRPDHDNIGMFGFVLEGSIKGVGLINCDVTGGSFVGGLIGFTYMGELTDSYNSGVVTGEHHIGGLGGKNDQGTVSSCHSSCDVSASYYVGGFFGGNHYGTISDCYSDGTAIGTSTWVGGLIGECSGSINNCYSSCDVEGSQWIGGLVGNVFADISNCYSYGTVTGDSWVGGLIGANQSGVIINCYSFSSISANYIVGGLIGKDYSGGTIYDCYYNSDLTGQSDTGKGEPLTTKEMQTFSMYENWDFVGLTSDGTDDIWTISSGVNNGYPVFSWQIDDRSSPLMGSASMTLNSDSTCAILSGSFISLGVPNPVAYGFCYSTENEVPDILTCDTTCIGAVNGNDEAGLFTDVLNNIDMDKTYYLRSYAINATDTVYSSGVLSYSGINLIESVNNIEVYPNPVTSVLYVKEATGEVLIYNNAGQQVLCRNLDESNSIDVSGLAKGIYLLRVNGQAFKLIKN